MTDLFFPWTDLLKGKLGNLALAKEVFINSLHRAQDIKNSVVPLAELADASVNSVPDPLSIWKGTDVKQGRVQSRLRFQNWPTQHALTVARFLTRGRLFLPGCAADLRPEVGRTRDREDRKGVFHK